jgi:hypothetical protein
MKLSAAAVVAAVTVVYLAVRYLKDRSSAGGTLSLIDWLTAPFSSAAA